MFKVGLKALTSGTYSGIFPWGGLNFFLSRGLSFRGPKNPPKPPESHRFH